MSLIRVADLYWFWQKDLNLGIYPYCIPGKSVTRGLDKGHIAAGLWLKQTANPDDVIVLFDAGAIPYYSGLKTIDIWSLNDWELIQLRRQFKLEKAENEKLRIMEDMQDYVLDQEPEFIVQDNIGLLNKSGVRDRYHRVGPTFVYIEGVPRKASNNPFVQCELSKPYEIRIWQRIE
jgi:hypothetical protein